MKKIFIALLYGIMASISHAADINKKEHHHFDHSIQPHDQDLKINILQEMKEALHKEGNSPGYFIKSIIADLKQCSNEKLLMLNYLTIKSAYWWDREPAKRLGFYDQTDDPEIQKYKEFLIDRKFRSSVYDREGPERNEKLQNLLAKFSTVPLDLVNSWGSVAEKVKFFFHKDIGQPKGLIGKLDFGYPLSKPLDTYPSVFQMMETAKTLKYTQQQSAHLPEKCPTNLQSIESKKPSQVIIDTLNQLFQKQFYQEFSNQNHPLSKIVQDHLKKLHHIATVGKRFSGDPIGKEENGTSYNRNLLFQKTINNIEKMIRYMSVFKIDIDQKICEIEGLTVRNPTQDPYYLYAQCYEIINDLLFMLMYSEGIYSYDDFNSIITKAQVLRTPSLQKLKTLSNIMIESYPMRSGMDAFVNASMASNYIPLDISIAPKVFGLANKVYYEISELLQYSSKAPTHQYISLSRPASSNEIQEIKDQFILEYLTENLKDIRPTYGENKKQENDEFFSSFVERFKREPFNHRSAVFYYESKHVDEDAHKKTKSMIVKKIFNEIKGLGIYSDLFDFKEYQGMAFIKIPDSIDVHLFNAIKKKHTLLEDIFDASNQPSIVTGITPDTVDQTHDAHYIDHLYRKMTSILAAQRMHVPTNQPAIILWDITLEINQGTCYAMIEKFQEEIKTGKIVFILFKSLQKYASLGVGKMKAGAVTLVGEKTSAKHIHEKLEKYAGDVWDKNGFELMLMIFYNDRFKDGNTLETLGDLQDNRPLSKLMIGAPSYRFRQLS